MLLKKMSHWWVIALAALLHGFLTPPWNHERHWFFFLAPFISTFALLPFFHIAYSDKKHWVKGVLYWLYGALSVGAGSYWVLDVKVAGKPLIMIQALVALALFFGAWFIPVGLSLSLLKKYRPTLLWLSFPACWILFDYLRTLGELSFPWHFDGYTYMHFASFAQLSTVTGIWGVTFLVVMVAFTMYLLLREGKRWRLCLLGQVLFILGALVAGALSLTHKKEQDRTARFALIQSNMDQEKWDGIRSLDSALTISDSMLGSVVDDSVDFAVLPESGVFCYLLQTGFAKRAVLRWRNAYKMAIITGTLHRGPSTDYREVYNSCFYLPTEGDEFQKYFKQKLVPFGESLPFKGFLPLINRLDLGGGDFSRGSGNAQWELGDSITTTPLICYEAIYPSYIRQRAQGAQLLLNVTNDGWFGDGSGPFQHRTITRARAIENGLPLVRTANSGISFAVDYQGRYLAASALGTREVILVDVPLMSQETLYRKWGDWILLIALAIIVISLFFRTSPVSSKSI